MGNKIRLVDSDSSNGENPYDLYCYVKCSDNEDPVVKNCRGAILSDGKLVLQTFGFTPELTPDQTEKIHALLPSIEGTRVFESHEGSLLRIACINKKWYIFTHRKLDAHRSKWASRESFGDLFEASLRAEYEENDDLKQKLDTVANEGEDPATLSNFYKVLNPENCYCFLVRNTIENRIVCQPPSRPTLYHVGTFLNRGVDGQFSLDEHVGIPHPKEYTYSSVDEIIEAAKEVDEDELQGLIAFNGTHHVKLITQAYSKLFSIRGNEPSIKYRYLQIRMDSEKVDLLYQLYPRYTDTFEDYENKLYAIAKSIYSAYVSRFIKKQYITVPREEYQVMRSCHSWHLEDRSKNRISQRKVVEKLNAQSPTNLNKMIRHYTLQQEEEKEKTKSTSMTSQTLLSPISIEPTLQNAASHDPVSPQEGRAAN
jgi:hypothetical protein